MILAKNLSKPACYDADEIEKVENHIASYFGTADVVLHEFASEDIHADIYVIPPHEGHPYYTLVTFGMGAYEMNVPQEYLSQGVLPRMELVICLPPEWDPKSEKENDTWPANLMRWLARYPLREHTWLAYSHTISNGAPFSGSTLLSACVLLGIQDAPQGAAVCRLDEERAVAFYQIIPLTEKELQYDIEHGLNAMLAQMKDLDHVVYAGRAETDFV